MLQVPKQKQKTIDLPEIHGDPVCTDCLNPNQCYQPCLLDRNHPIQKKNTHQWKEQQTNGKKSPD